jgi:hypothetical protein
MCALSAFFKHEVCRVPGAIPADQDSGLFCREATLAGFAAPLAGSTTQALSSSLLRFKKVSLIGFSNARQADRLLIIGQRQEAVAPTECRVGMNPQRSGTFADARPLYQLLRVVHPFRFVPKSRPSGVSVRALKVARQALQRYRCKPLANPQRETCSCAQCGTVRLLGHPGFNQLVGCRRLRRRLQPIHQYLPLVRRQFLQRTR